MRSRRRRRSLRFGERDRSEGHQSFHKSSEFPLPRARCTNPGDWRGGPRGRRRVRATGEERGWKIGGASGGQTAAAAAAAAPRGVQLRSQLSLFWAAAPSRPAARSPPARANSLPAGQPATAPLCGLGLDPPGSAQLSFRHQVLLPHRCRVGLK